MAERIDVIRGSCGAADALSVALAVTGNGNAQIETEVIYPYHCFDAICRTPVATGKKPLATRCLVDAVNGLGSTADDFEVAAEAVVASMIMTMQIDDLYARRVAERTVTHRLARSFRTIADFGVDLSPRGLVHKRFWIVCSGEARLLVDSTTAGWAPLKYRAA